MQVRDTGIGMSPEEQAQLFTRFFRARNRTTQEVCGTGLGLAITRSLVEMHGGQILVESAPGQGSTFSFTLPVAPEAPEPEEAVPPCRPGGRILVVDDALRLAQTECPDLITLDVMLPDADGFTVLEWLKSDPQTAGIPVVLLSIMPDNGEGKQLGAVDYLTKPVREQVLLDRLHSILPWG